MYIKTYIDRSIRLQTRSLHWEIREERFFERREEKTREERRESFLFLIFN